MSRSSSRIEAIDWKRLLHSELHARDIRPDEVIGLCEAYGPTDFYYAVVDIGRSYFRSFSRLRGKQSGRRGEVVTVIRNRQNRVLLHTKKFYPPDLYRLLTGGIRKNENVIDALHRELLEETSYSPVFLHLQAIVLYILKNGRRRLPYSSYIFNVKVNDGRPSTKDLSEGISGFEWLPPARFGEVIARLEGLFPERLGDWGRFRAVAHRIAAAEC